MTIKSSSNRHPFRAATAQLRGDKKVPIGVLCGWKCRLAARKTESYLTDSAQIKILDAVFDRIANILSIPNMRVYLNWIKQTQTSRRISPCPPSVIAGFAVVFCEIMRGIAPPTGHLHRQRLCTEYQMGCIPGRRTERAKPNGKSPRRLRQR